MKIQNMAFPCHGHGAGRVKMALGRVKMVLGRVKMVSERVKMASGRVKMVSGRVKNGLGKSKDGLGKGKNGLGKSKDGLGKSKNGFPEGTGDSFVERTPLEYPFPTPKGSSKGVPGTFPKGMPLAWERDARGMGQHSSLKTQNPLTQNS